MCFLTAITLLSCLLDPLHRCVCVCVVYTMKPPAQYGLQGPAELVMLQQLHTNNGQKSSETLVYHM
jgi:hypothetical protein